MYLLVVQDRARMPRLRAALSGLDPWQPLYGEAEYALAHLSDRVQALSHLMHTVHADRLTPKKPPEFSPYPRPGEKPKQVGPPKLSKQQVDYLERFAPAV